MREQIAKQHTAAHTLRANLLGSFSLTDGVATLTYDSIHSTMLSRLLIYFLCHRGRNLSVQELIDVLWNDKDSDNPAGALKNLVYRLRTTLSKTFERNDFISTGRGFYVWNREVSLALDFEEFETLCKECADFSKGNSVQMEKYARALNLYRGNFAEEQVEELWIVPLVTYYHSLYLSAVKAYVALLETTEQYETITAVCTRAIALDHLDEHLYACKIRSLVRQGKKNLALEQYNTYTTLLYENMGVRPSDELRAIYREIVEQNNALELDLGNIQKDLAESAALRGVFMTEYSNFKDIYRLQVRSVQRMGISVYVALLTCTISSYIPQGSDAYLSLANDAMRRLEEVLRASLRRGDVAAKYSGTQFVLLLPSCTYETGTMIIQRLLDRFFHKYNKRAVTIQYRLSQLQMPD